MESSGWIEVDTAVLLDRVVDVAGMEREMTGMGNAWKRERKARQEGEETDRLEGEETGGHEKD